MQKKTLLNRWKEMTIKIVYNSKYKRQHSNEG